MELDNLRRNVDAQVVFDWGSDAKVADENLVVVPVRIARGLQRKADDPLGMDSANMASISGGLAPVVAGLPEGTARLEPFPQAPEPAQGAFYRCFCGEMHPKTFSASEHATEAAWLRTKANEWIGHAQYFKEKGMTETHWVIQDCLGMLKVTKAYAAYHEAQARLAGA